MNREALKRRALEIHQRERARRPGAVSFAEASAMAAQELAGAPPADEVACAQGDDGACLSMAEPQRPVRRPPSPPATDDNAEVVRLAERQLAERGVHQGDPGYYPELKRQLHAIGNDRANERRRREFAAFSERTRQERERARTVDPELAESARNVRDAAAYRAFREELVERLDELSRGKR